MLHYEESESKVSRLPCAHKERSVSIGWALHLVPRAYLLSGFAEHFVVVPERCRAQACSALE